MANGHVQGRHAGRFVARGTQRLGLDQIASAQALLLSLRVLDVIDALAPEEPIEVFHKINSPGVISSRKFAPHLAYLGSDRSGNWANSTISGASDSTWRSLPKNRQPPPR